MFAATGRRLIFEGTPDAAAAETVGDLFQILEHRQLTVDELLVDFAATLRSCIRSHDMLVRYGGEEFCCVLSCDMHMAKIVTKRVRDLWSEHPSRVAFSAGLAAIEPAESAIYRADVALYISKRDGRNTSTVFRNGDGTMTLG